MVTETGGKGIFCCTFSTTNHSKLSRQFIILFFYNACRVHYVSPSEDERLTPANADPKDGRSAVIRWEYVRDFISIIERHGEIAGLSHDKLPPYVIQYCTEEVKRVIRWNDELDGSDWTKAKELLLSLYGIERRAVERYN